MANEQNRPGFGIRSEARDLYGTEQPASRLRDQPPEPSASRRIAAWSHLYDVLVSGSDRLGAWCGLLGPAAFTAAWLVAQRRQDEYEVRHEHISGLAAKDANDPHVMTAGFVALGGCTVVFASALDRRLGPRAGMARADRGRGPRDDRGGPVPSRSRSKFPLPGSQGQSRRTTCRAAAVVGGSPARWTRPPRAAPRAGPAFRDLAGPRSGRRRERRSLAWFVRDVVRPGNGLIQRANVSIPLAFMTRLAFRMLSVPGSARSNASPET